MESTQLCQYWKTRDVRKRYCLVKSPGKVDDCYSRDGMRLDRGSPCAVLLPLSMAASSPEPTRSVASDLFSLPLNSSGSPFSPVLEIKLSLQLVVLM